MEVDLNPESPILEITTNDPPKKAQPISKQQPLITITLDTYKASRINSIISKFSMRIEPIEGYLSEVQKKEAALRKD